MTTEELKQIKNWYYKEYCMLCIYEDHTEPMSYEEWLSHTDEKGRWVR